MIRPVVASLGVAVVFAALAVLSHAARLERSVSSSRQFFVHGANVRLRGVICDLAERTKRDALRVFGGRDEWQTPIVIDAVAPDFERPGAPIALLKVNQTGAGLKFQLELQIATEVEMPKIERELLRAVLLEMMYRAARDIPPGTPYIDPPEWLLQGLLALSPERDSAPIAQLLTTAGEGGGLTLEEFLQQKRALLDSPSQALYDAYSAALVSLLVESPEGRARLAGFVAQMDQGSNDSFADLKTHFPALGATSDQMEKHWRGSVARRAAERHRMLDCEETERQLAEVLQVQISAAGRTVRYGLEEFSEFRRHPTAAIELKRLTTELVLLSGRAHPVYRSVVAEYQLIAAQLLRRKAPKARRLAELRAAREGLARRMEAIADYLNWWEATQARVASRTFREYLRAAEKAAERAPRRRDPISVYLDALETQF